MIGQTSWLFDRWRRMRSDCAQRTFCLKLILFLILSTFFAARALTLASQSPLHAVQVSGCPRYTTELDSPEATGETFPRFVTSVGRPRWGLEWSAGRFLPWLIDGHIGAWPAYPFCGAIAWGGVILARALLVLGGCLMLLLLLLLGRLLLVEPAGWIAVFVAATSPHFLVVHSSPIPYEVWSYLFPTLAVFLILRARRTTDPESATRSRVPELATAAAAVLCLGLGVAAKQTALWMLAALSVGAVVAGWRPRLGRISVAVVLFGLFCLPLFPQILYVIITDAPALGERLNDVGAGADYLSFDRLSFFVGVFYDCFVRLAAFTECTVLSAECGGSPWHVLAGCVLLAFLVWLLVAAVMRKLPILTVGFAAGFVTLLAAHYAFYYEGLWLYELLTPWVPLAVGIAAWSSWTHLKRPLARSLPLLGLVVLAANQLSESHELFRALSTGNLSITLAAQETVTQELMESDVTAPWVATSSLRGVLETLSDHEIRPHYVDDLFSDILREKPAQGDLDQAWGRSLSRMGPGRHTVIVPGKLAAIEIRDGTAAHLFFERLRVVTDQRRGQINVRRVFANDGGQVLLRLVDIELPQDDPSLPASPQD
jgi:hypothetical protein